MRAGAGRHAVDQAVLPSSTWTAGWRSTTPRPSPASGAGRAQRRLVPHGQRRRHLDAGQVGVSLVRRLGPRVPLPGAGRWSIPISPRSSSSSCCGATICIPTARCPPMSGTSATSIRRSMPGRRIFVYRDRQGAQRRRRRRRVPRARLPEAAAELHLVGQPQGPQRPQRLRGRLPRPRQYRRLRPQRAAADRRPHGPGRRHRLDGAVLPRTCCEIAIELAAHDPVYEELAIKFFEHFIWIASAIGPDGRPPGRAVGRGGRLLLRCAAPARRQRQRLKVRSMVGLAAALRRHRVRAGSCDRAARRVERATAGSSSACPTWSTRIHCRRRPGDAADAAARRRSTRTQLRRILTRMLDENEFLSPYGIRSLRATTRDHPYVFDVGGQEYRVDYLPAESDYRHVRRQLELARARSGCRSTS